VSLPDAAHDGHHVNLRIHSPIPPMRDAACYFTWLIWRLRVVEVHELLEWFKVDGSPWIDPHEGLDREV
jgi:hypothetical protein